MYHVRRDRRSVRSAEAIYSALAALIAEGDYETIKVSALAERAQVGRATFYRNFDTIEDVLRWRCDRVTDELVEYLTEYVRTHAPDSRIPLLKPLLRFFYLHSDIVEVLIDARRSDLLRIALKEQLARFATSRAAMKEVPEDLLEYGAVIRSSAAVGVLVHWVREGKRQAPDDLADGLAEMVQKMTVLDMLL